MFGRKKEDRYVELSKAEMRKVIAMTDAEQADMDSKIHSDPSWLLATNHLAKKIK